MNDRLVTEIKRAMAELADATPPAPPLEELLIRLPDLELAVDPKDLVRRPANFVSGLEAMPVKFSPSAPLNRSTL